MTEEEYNEKLNTMDKCVEYWQKKAEKLEKVNKEFKEQLFAFDNERTKLRGITHRVCKERRRLRRRNEELKKEIADLIFIRDARAKLMCDDKARLIAARGIIKDLLSWEDRADYDYNEYDDIKEKAMNFLKGE